MKIDVGWTGYLILCAIPELLKLLSILALVAATVALIKAIKEEAGRK